MMNLIRAPGVATDVAALNAVTVTAERLEAVDIAEAPDGAVAARHAALGWWMATQDPDCRFDRATVLEAAALAPLVQTDDGPAFDTAQFSELIAFIADLPW